MVTEKAKNGRILAYTGWVYAASIYIYISIKTESWLSDLYWPLSTHKNCVLHTRSEKGGGEGRGGGGGGE